MAARVCSEMRTVGSETLIWMREKVSARGWNAFLVAALICGSSASVYLRVVFSQLSFDNGTTTIAFSTNVAPPPTNPPIVLQRQEQQGSWIGNTWIPPKGWRYYSADELIDFYGERSLLWVGDSTGWGAARTLYGVLNHKTTSKYLESDAVVKPKKLPGNKEIPGKFPCDSYGYAKDLILQNFCHDMPEGRPGGKFLFTRRNTLYQLESFLLNEISGAGNMTKNVDLIIVTVGVWEQVRPKDCKDKSGKNRTTNALLNDTIALLEQFQSNGTMIVWTTSGFREKISEEFLVDLNEKAMNEIDDFSLKHKSSNNATSNLTYIDWGAVALPRSYGQDRIKGDMLPHYGIEARHAAIQMVTNQAAGMLERPVSPSTLLSSPNVSPPPTNPPIVLKRQEQRGSWIGNTWIPPKGWKYYSEDELIDFYRDRSLLWIGDSTGWGAARTLFGVLNRKTGRPYLKSPAVVKPFSEYSRKYPCDAFGYVPIERNLTFCQKMPERRSGGTNNFLFAGIHTLCQLESFLLDELSLKSNMTQSADLIIVSLGVWDKQVRPWDNRRCQHRNRNRNALLKDTMALLAQLQSSGTLIVWTTSGFGNKKTKKFLVNLNEKAMNEIDDLSYKQQRSNNVTSNLTYVDWGGAVLPRSFGDDRIKGDMLPHYGVEARNTAIQMITNQVAGMLERAVRV
jgi:hypothetical protein